MYARGGGAAGSVGAAMKPPRAAAPVVAAAVALGACGGGERQDAGAPTGTFRVDVTRASFPARQGLAEAATLRLDVRNTGRRAVPDLAVTVETARVGAGRRRATAGEGAGGGTTGGVGSGATGGFAVRAAAPGLADAGRPVWLLDAEPEGGHTAYVGTWAFGPLPRRATRSIRFGLTPARPGRYRVRWRVAPALEGDARLRPGGRTRGAFGVTITAAPAPSRVGRAGRVVRGR